MHLMRVYLVIMPTCRCPFSLFLSTFGGESLQLIVGYDAIVSCILDIIIGIECCTIVYNQNYCNRSTSKSPMQPNNWSKAIFVDLYTTDSYSSLQHSTMHEIAYHYYCYFCYKIQHAPTSNERKTLSFSPYQKNILGLSRPRIIFFPNILYVCV